jgi:voltage-gated potassium channel
MAEDTEVTPPRSEQLGPFQLVILVLSIYVLIALFVEAAVDLSPEVRTLLQHIDNAICVIFLIDFSVRLARSRDRMRFLRWGWIDALSSIPMVDAFRWGRLVRIIRILRMLRAFRSTRVLVKYFFRNRALGTFATVALISVTLTIFSSIAVLNFEDVPESNIKSASDALWWSFVTITTVGYGDKFPVTPEGRVIAVFLMTAGVGLFGTFTGLLASFFIEADQEKDEEEADAILVELKAIREELSALRMAAASRPTSP